MKISWDQIKQESLTHLRELVKLDTSNPPGNERIAIDYYANVLGRHDIDFTVRESADPRQPRRADEGARFLEAGAADVLARRCGPGRSGTVDAAAVQRGDRQRLRVGPRFHRYETQVRDGPRGDDLAQARGHPARMRSGPRRGGR